MNLTRQHFEFIARVLEESRANQETVNRFARNLATTNPRFDRTRFLEATGTTTERATLENLEGYVSSGFASVGYLLETFASYSRPLTETERTETLEAIDAFGTALERIESLLARGSRTLARTGATE